MPTVVILICTFNRPHYLSELLTALGPEVASTPCKTLSVVVIDNGTQDVRRLVDAFQDRLPIEYVRLPSAGLVVARNASLRRGLKHKPDYLAFIDDDEVPEGGWLAGLLSTMSSSGADFAVGPVNPQFSETPPPWAPDFFTKSGEAFCTSNLIVRTSAVPRDEAQWFQSRFNLTGGEDGDFLSRLVKAGATNVVASSALVHEHIPKQRVTLKYLWRRGLRDGVVISIMTSSKHGGRLRLLRQTLPMAAAKLMYGLNHAFWSVANRDRIPRAIDDFAMATGLIMGSLNFSVNLYGHGS